jgi:hypothetical protein
MHSWHVYLYMDREGGHAILGSGIEWYTFQEDHNSERDDLVTQARDGADLGTLYREHDERNDARLSALEKESRVYDFDIDALGWTSVQPISATFEEFLAQTYFSEWALYLAERTSEANQNEVALPPAFEEYLVKVFSEDNRLR